jgi:Predicted membrane protein (DUF2232)
MTLAGFILTLLTLIWGAPFIRVLRQRFGFLAFWTSGILLSLATYEMWFLVASVWIVVGVFSELEAKGVRWIWNGILSVTLGTAVLVGGAFKLSRDYGLVTMEQLAGATKTFFLEKTLLQLPAEFDFMTIVRQFPSIAVIAIVLVLAHALIFEKAVYRWFRIPRERFAAQIKLLDFKLPDIFVWIGMVSFLGAILEWKGQNHAINILNVCIVLFFLQGIAVLEYFYKTLRVGIFVRALGYFLFVFQLFVVLSFVGFIDFWIDFRKRIRKLPAKSQDNQNARLL